MVSVVLTAGMYFLIGHLTKSLRMLTESVRKTGEGNYRERVDIHAKDETGILADKVRNSKNNGVGLGLSICADIVKIHNARIELDRKLEKGTLVKIIFPCYK